MHRHALSSVAAVLLTLLGVLPAGADPASSDTVWHQHLDKALAEAGEGGADRLIFVDLFAEWCGWCKVLEKEVFTTPQFREYTRDMVLLRVDVDDGGEGSDLQARYQAFSLPTTLVIDRRMARVASVAGYAPVDRFLQMIDAEVQGYRNLVAWTEKVLAGNDSKALADVAGELHERGDGRRAADVYARLIELGDHPRREGWLHFLLADAHRMAGQFDAARNALERARPFTTGEQAMGLAEEVDLLLYRIAQDAGDCQGAQSSLQRFIKKHPHSRHRPEAEAALGDLVQGHNPSCA